MALSLVSRYRRKISIIVDQFELPSRREDRVKSARIEGRKIEEEKRIKVQMKELTELRYWPIWRDQRRFHWLKNGSLNVHRLPWRSGGGPKIPGMRKWRRKKRTCEKIAYGDARADEYGCAELKTDGGWPRRRGRTIADAETWNNKNVSYDKQRFTE